MNLIKCRDNMGKFVDIPSNRLFFRPSAYGLIFNKNQLVTMKNRSNGKIWFPGGGIEIGEKLEDGLRREILEETGLRVNVNKLVLFKENFFYYQPLKEAYHAFLFFFLCFSEEKRLISDDKVDDYESTNPRWTRIDSIRKEDIGDLEEDLFKVINELKREKTY